jgi:hypothetical protein
MFKVKSRDVNGNPVTLTNCRDYDSAMRVFDGEKVDPRVHYAIVTQLTGRKIVTGYLAGATATPDMVHIGSTEVDVMDDSGPVIVVYSK